MEENKKIINQTGYERLVAEGFPEGCLSDAYIDGVVVTKLPENIEITRSRFHECKFTNISVSKLGFTDCIIADGILSNIKADELSVQGTTVYGTLFTGLSIDKIDLSNATFRHSSMRDGDIEELYLSGATLNSTYFHRLKELRD